MYRQYNHTDRRRPGRGLARLVAPVAVAMIASGVWGQAQSKPDSDRPSKDGQKLGERLIRQAAGGEDEGVMERIVRLMKTSSRRLIIEFDVGEQTQTIQDDIVDNLDVAIRKAAARRRPQRSRDRSQRSDKRRRSQMASKDQRSDRPQGANGKSGADSASAAAGTVADADRASGGRLHETRRTWGHLPQRDREEFIQGIGERFLDRYREWIERYYRALQEDEN